MDDYIIGYSKKTYRTFWFRQNGETRSYRFHRDKAAEEVARLIDSGADLIPDPFRKGAPLGGHSER